MEEFQLKAPRGATKKKQIVGRGDSAGKGSRCGRGNKGQKARSGGSIRPGFEGGQMPLYRRVARKGFSNYPFKKEVVGVNLSVLAEKFGSNETVNAASLVEKGIVKKSENLVKILGEGELTVKLNVEGLPVSASARKKIEAAGGTVVLPERETGNRTDAEDQKKAEAPAKKEAKKPVPKKAKAPADAEPASPAEETAPQASEEEKVEDRKEVPEKETRQKEDKEG